jgi:3-hydroxyisobutyrate dehydrogenase
MAKIAWFGTGMMGSGFVEALLRRGERVAVWNRTPEKTRLLEALGATGFADPSEAARGADRIHIMLSDDAAVDALLDRIASAIAPSAIVIDHTTVAPRPTAARFERCERESIAFLHAPVFMSPQMTREGKGIMLCSGPAERFERARSFLAAMTADLWYVGERTDKAAALKLFGNQMIFFITAGLADGFALTRSVDLPPREAFELFSHFKPAATIDFRGKKIAEGDFSSSFDLTMARKDARLMLETAQAGDVELHVLPAIARWMDETIERGYGDRDLAVLGADAVPVRA